MNQVNPQFFSNDEIQYPDEVCIIGHYVGTIRMMDMSSVDRRLGFFGGFVTTYALSSPLTG
jgi:hypothetical protein